MVVSIDVKHVFKYPVHLVADTHLTKYPTEKDQFVEKVVTVEHAVDQDKGLDYKRRLAFCKNVVPNILRKVSALNEDHVVLEEETWQDIATGNLHIKSRNITWSKYAIMREESKFSPSEENPQWTKFEQHGHFEIPNFGFFGSVLESFADKFIHSHGVNKALNVMEELLKEKSSNEREE